MSELDLSGLKSVKAKTKAKPAWEPLQLQSLHRGIWLAADPSLGAFGLVLFEVNADGPVVQMAQTFKTEPEATGHEDTLARAEIMEIQLRLWSQTYLLNRDWGPVQLVHEAPPVGGGKMYSPEVSLLSGYAFRRAFREYPRVSMVRPQDHCRLICGNANAKKPEHHRELKVLFPRITGAGEWITNEGTRDALSVALAAAAR